MTDPNLRGAVLEKVLPPDGTDRLPYRVRDLGTIFFLSGRGFGFRIQEVIPIRMAWVSAILLDPHRWRGFFLGTRRGGQAGRIEG